MWKTGSGMKSFRVHSATISIKRSATFRECVFLNRTAGEWIEKGLEDYFQGIKSYEQCVEDLKQSLSE